MTVSANPTPDFQRDQIITGALGLCGLVPAGGAADPDQIAQGAFHLSLALLELETEGVQLTGLERDTETLVDGTEEYTLPTDTLDVKVNSDDVAGMTVDSDGVEVPVIAVSAAEYQRIGDKTTTADRPTKVFIEKGANAVALVFWPVPSDSTMSFSFTRVRLLRDMDTGAVTMEMKRIYAPWLTYKTASGLAAANSKYALAAQYRSWAADLLTKVKNTDTEKVRVRLRPGNSGVNWR